MIQASAPGKLFIAGEYAVVTPAHPAILVAVNQFITVTLEEAIDSGSIHSSLNQGLPIPWTRLDGSLYIDQRENTFIYITEAIKITEDYIQEQGISLRFFHLSVESELDNAKGKKYGLGSSGAVTVATVKALLQFYGLTISPELVYKLSSLAHLVVKSNGSFGDIAASAYTGWIAYASFDRDWVIEKQASLSITELVALNWPGLMVHRLTVPKEIQLLIGWTASPASTTHLVDRVNQQRADMAEFFPQFLQKSKQIVTDLISAFDNKNISEIKDNIRKNRFILKELAAKAGVPIETTLLEQLIKIASSYDAASKTSGAGGGDCGIALLNDKAAAHLLLQEWEKAGIQPLPLEVYQEDCEGEK